MRHLLRRVLWALPILVGVNLLTFALFFVVNDPDDVARTQLGDRRVEAAAIERWKAERGYDRPLLWNAAARGTAQFTDTIFWRKSVALFRFDFGRSDAGRDIGWDIRQRMGPSLAIAVPTLILGLLVNVTVALAVATVAATRLDLVATMLCVVAMSISGLFYVIVGQFVAGRLLNLVPISGWGDGWDALRFAALPVAIGVVSGIGSGVRFYRTVFLEEMGRDYVRTARAKGLSEARVLGVHVLRNGLIPILTGVVVVLPSLFLGSLVMESFFAVPGLGSYTLDAIEAQDFAAVRVMVFLGAVLYIVGLVLTDLAYTIADPRVRLG